MSKNMKTKTITFLLTMLTVVFSCSTDIDDPISVSENKENICTMRLNGSVVPFDYSGESRATTSYSWSNGDKLYIIFTAASGSTTNGTATYNSTTRTWDVTYTSALVRDKSTSCKVYFFEGLSSNSEIITLTSVNPVFGDEKATYSFPTGGDLTITASIKPLTSRIRFKGSIGTALTITGITNHNAYSLSYGLQPLKQNSAISTTIQSDGYTPYIYGVFESSTTPGISIAYNNQSFTADCKGLSILQIGKSGWMNVPTTTSHNGWIANTSGGTIGGHDYVDLGLPSGTLWATCNVGANKPEDFGDYFSWGETFGYKSGKVNFDEAHYKYYNGNKQQITKYCSDPNYGYNGFTDGKSELELMDDAAYVNWGTEWRMPTNTQLYELMTQTTAVFSDVNGVKGYKMFGKNGQFIFLPAASSYKGDVLLKGLNNGKYPGCYWSRNCFASIYVPCVANCFSFEEYQFYYAIWDNKELLDITERHGGASIRAVIN